MGKIFPQKRFCLQFNGFDIKNSVFSMTTIKYYRLEQNLTDVITTTIMHYIVIKILYFYKTNFNAIMVVLNGIPQKPAEVPGSYPHDTW